jgi:glycosyltransferase involved in cell wall biosynthesis
MPLPTKLAFFTPDELTSGGMPDDIKHFVDSIAEMNCVETVLFCPKLRSDSDGQLINVPKVDINSINNTYRSLKTLKNGGMVVFFTFSSMKNVFWSIISRFLGIPYTVIPSWQVHDFLDKDRPFPRKLIPTIEASEKKPDDFRSTGGGVVEGNYSIFSYLRLLKRVLFRKTLGSYFVNNASAIHVFSDFEKFKIKTLLNLKNPFFLPIDFGTDIQNKPIGPDTYPSNVCINILFWGRVDYYYKGIDRVLNSIAKAKNTGIKAPFKFWICGPDYNDGYKKVSLHVKRLGLQDYVKILNSENYTPGTIGYLKNADYVITFSRWDGYARVLRECLALGVPIISNRETHFDSLISKFGIGVLVDFEEELAKILTNLDDVKMQSVKSKAQSFYVENSNYLSWYNCAERFLKNLKESNFE